MVWSEIEGWKRAKQLRAILIGFSIFTVLVVGANIAMAISVAGRASKPTRTCLRSVEHLLLLSGAECLVPQIAAVRSNV